jgi:hypothetical protein
MGGIFTDDFNSYNNGDLNGQGSWSGNAYFDVQDVIKYEGARGVAWTETGIGNNGYLTISKTGTAQTDGSVSVWVRAGTHTGTFIGNVFMQFDLASGATEKINTGLGNDYSNNKHFAYFPTAGADWTYLTDAWVADQWYNLQIEWRSSDHQSRMKIDNGSWTDWVTTYDTNWTTLDTIVLVVHYAYLYQGGDYWDYITLPTTQSSGTPYNEIKGGVRIQNSVIIK